MSFFAVEPLTLMVSSRCSDKVLFQGRQQPMSEVRRAIKGAIEGIQFGGKPVFEVWIHEDEAVLAGDQSSSDHCMVRARRADVVLVLYNGNAGWAGTSEKTGDHVGICHAEFQAAFDRCPGKIRSVQFPDIAVKPGSPDERFQQYFRKQGIFGAQVSTGEAAIASATEAAVAALLDLARAGVGVNSQGSYYAGEALEWTRLDFQKRREVTRSAAIEFLRQRAPQTADNLPPNTVVYSLRGEKVAFVCDCIPASLMPALVKPSATQVDSVPEYGSRLSLP